MGFADDHLLPLADEGPGNNSRLVDPGDGHALPVDAGQVKALLADGDSQATTPFVTRGHGERAMTAAHGRRPEQGLPGGTR